MRARLYHTLRDTMRAFVNAQATWRGIGTDSVILGSVGRIVARMSPRLPWRKASQVARCFSPRCGDPEWSGRGLKHRATIWPAKRGVFGLILALFLVLTGLVMAQRFGRGGFWGGESGGSRDAVRTAREIPTHSTGTPLWTNPKGFEHDVFTFSRIRYSYGRSGGYYGRRGGGWATDLPDSDLNLSYRLQQMTSMKCSPDGRIIELTDPDLAEYPWIYIVEPGGLGFSDLEVVALRKYLLNGGFLMFDDFWGESAWLNVEREMKRVFPDRGFAELSLDHPLYSCVFQIKSKGQVPNVRTGEESQHTGVTWEEHHDGDTQTVHHRAIHDDKGRMMVFAAHNTDNGDGWEREGEYEYYFKNFSEKIAYPLGINVVFYAMTH